MSANNSPTTPPQHIQGRAMTCCAVPSDNDDDDTDTDDDDDDDNYNTS